MVSVKPGLAQPIPDDRFRSLTHSLDRKTLFQSFKKHGMRTSTF